MRIKVTKRAICAVIALIMAMSAFSAFAAAQTVEPCFNNVVRVSNHAEVSSSGKLTATNRYTADANVFSKAIITTYVEKRFSVCFGAGSISVKTIISGST